METPLLDIIHDEEYSGTNNDTYSMYGYGSTFDNEDIESNENTHNNTRNRTRSATVDNTPPRTRREGMQAWVRRQHSENVLSSKRLAASFVEDKKNKFTFAPSLLHDNFALQTDPTISDAGRGRLYMLAESFYNKDSEPMYVVTMREDIYGRILSEVVDRRSVPCGLYFCCHGGDGAHTGISYDDYVDIRLAWALIALLLTSMSVLAAID